ncbi:MAG TPA: efflux RND transporter periplasmic adaptor subunit [Terriglobales bacterium]|nr:efflux RND transporter periplasmic adaptor subunit [Terriglobales bacterium]
MRKISRPKQKEGTRRDIQRALAGNRPAQMLGAFVLGCSLLLAAGCSSHDSANMTSYSGGGASNNAELFSIPQDQMAHIQMVTVEPASLARTLRLTGVVAFNGFATTPVITQVGGLVSRVLVSPGQSVKRGQALLYVSSPDFSQLRATYLKANDAYQFAEKEYQRAKDLFDHHAIAERDLLAAESARVQASADLQSSQQALQVLGFHDMDEVAKSSSSPEIPVLAPIAGEIVERLISQGQVIQAGVTQAFTISNMSTVWVLANVYQQDLPYVHIGDAVITTADSYPSKEFHGKIAYIAPALDPATRTLQARIDVKNPHEELKKDMYVTSLVQAGKISNAFTLPSASILRSNENEPYVYVSAGNNQFQRRNVTLGETTEAATQITSGLKAGDRVIADGSLFVQFANSLQR